MDRQLRTQPLLPIEEPPYPSRCESQRSSDWEYQLKAWADSPLKNTTPRIIYMMILFIIRSVYQIGKYGN
jgi:hypothetical protein